MPGVSKGEVWLVDFGMVAKVRPALLLTGEPADDELDLVTVPRQICRLLKFLRKVRICYLLQVVSPSAGISD
jgi:mRNA-degrading endonuclease toxin of MazEF toxin-antitoxin module